MTPSSTSRQAARRIDWFSPIVAILEVSFSSTVPPPGQQESLSASMSLPVPSVIAAAVRTKSWNCSFLATKSVSELVSTIAPLLPSTTTPTSPSAAVRPAFLAAAARPLVLSQSIAASMSPPVSPSAFLQSIMPAPVRSRNSFTFAAVISAMSHILLNLYKNTVRPELVEGPSFLVEEREGFDRLSPNGRAIASPALRLRQRLLGGRLVLGAEILAAGLGAALLAGEHRVGDRVAIEADRPAGIVIAGDREGYALRADVRIEHRDDRDAEHVGFLDRELLLVGVDHEHDVGNAAHVANAAERKLELVALAGELEHLLLGEARSVAGELLLETLEALDRVGDRLPVGQHAAEPAMVDEMLAGAARRLGDRILGLALGADEEHLAARGDGLADEVERAREQRHGLRQVDDVHPVALAEY